MGIFGMVSSGHYLGSEAGMRILNAGGNAMDAAAAAGFALQVVLPYQNGFAGEAPMLLYSAKDEKTYALSGHGTAPAEVSIEKFRELGIDIIPQDGFLPAVVPSALASWILLLRRFGTMRLGQVMGPAIELTEKGFPVFGALREHIGKHAERYKREWPGSAEAFLVKGEAPAMGTVWRNPDLGRVMRQLVKAEERYRKRDDGLRAAHDLFYRGAMARKLVKFCRTTASMDESGKSHRGFLSEEDFAAYEAELEEPLSIGYRDWRVYKCGTWTQGPVLLQTLALLEGYDLGKMGHNSADYIHTVIEAMKLAFADREFHYGDPKFADVPMKRLLSKEYAAERRKLIDRGRASMELRPGGWSAVQGVESVLDVGKVFLAGGGKEDRRQKTEDRRNKEEGGKASLPTAHSSGDTTAIQVVDRAGNIISCVPSGGWLQTSPVVPGFGFPLGTRAQTFYLIEGHPNALRPGARPRTTLTPTLAGFGRRAPHLAMASPGGDVQDQWNLLSFLNIAEFGMSLQEAVEAPTFWTTHFPSSFSPR